MMIELGTMVSELSNSSETLDFLAGWTLSECQGLTLLRGRAKQTLLSQKRKGNSETGRS